MGMHFQDFSGEDSKHGNAGMVADIVASEWEPAWAKANDVFKNVIDSALAKDQGGAA